MLKVNIFSSRFILLLSFLICYCFVYTDILTRVIELWGDATGTYGHGYLIFSVFLYLCYETFKKNKDVHGETLYWVIIFLAFLLLIAYFSSDTISLLTLPVSMYLFVVYLFGWEIAKKYILIFAMLYFALPGWGVFTNPLRFQTVYIVKNILHFMQVPAYIEGAYVTLPFGKFFIAEGCSGLRYFLVGTTMSVMYGFTLFRNWKYRTIFIFIGIVVSIIANWVRVTAIILMGYYTKMETSLVHDHYYFGWFMFIALLLPVIFLGFKFQKYDKHNVDNENSIDIVSSEFKVVNLTKKAFVVVLSGGFIVLLLPVFMQVKLESKVLDLKNIDLDIEFEAYRSSFISSNAWKPNIDQYTFSTSSGYSNGTDKFDLFVFGYQKTRGGGSLSDQQHQIVDEKHWRILKTDKLSNQFISMEVGAAVDATKKVYLMYNVSGSITNNKYIARILQDIHYLIGRPISLMVAISIGCDISCDQNDKLVNEIVKELMPKLNRILDKFNTDLT